MVSRKVVHTRTSRNLDRVLRLKRKLRINAGRKNFIRLFGNTESVKLESILKNHENKELSFSGALAWVRSITHKQKSIGDGTYIPFDHETGLIRWMLRQRKKINENLDSDHESKKIVGMQDAMMMRAIETCPKIKELMTHESQTIRERAAATLIQLERVKALN